MIPAESLAGRAEFVNTLGSEVGRVREVAACEYGEPQFAMRSASVCWAPARCIRRRHAPQVRVDVSGAFTEPAPSICQARCAFMPSCYSTS